MKRLPTLLVAATCLAVSFGRPAVAAAATYPGYVYSWYMNTIDTTVLYNMGCSLGTARQGGSAPQNALVILDYGQPSHSSTYGYGAWAFGGTGFVSTTQIRNAVVEYAHGFWVCTGANTTAHVTIAVGTTNYANWSKNAGFTDAMVDAHAHAWASLANNINADITADGYQRQTGAVAAADIEVSWGTSTTARRWVDQYDTVNSFAMYDFGDAAGCRQSGTTSTAALCGGTWYQDDVYYMAWGAPPAFGVPEIYREDAAQAKQWQQVSKWATLNSKSRIWFTGTLTQHAACVGKDCTNIDNTAVEGWTQLVDQCATDSATDVTTIQFATDIKWH